MSSNLTQTEENYIKNIYHLQQSAGTVTTNDLAAVLHTRAASVTDMLKKLKAKKLLQYEPYKEFYLSPHGKRVALTVIRKHRLWEYFLVNKLQFEWHEVHEVAEELEHVASRKLVDKLDAFLDYPRFDPHGDPIPDSNGKIKTQHQVSLVDLPFNRQGEVTSVSNQSTELLELLKHKNIQIGTRLEIKRKFDFDNSFEVKVKNLSPVMISEQLAKALYVRVIV